MNKLENLRREDNPVFKKDGSYSQGKMNYYNFQDVRAFITAQQHNENKFELYEEILEKEEYTPLKNIFTPDAKVIGDETYTVGVLSCDTSTGCCNRNCGCHLSDVCYADEFRPSNLKYAMARSVYFNKNDAQTIAKDLEEYGVDIVRINEAGDFMTTEQVYKILDLCRLLPNVTFYGYVKSDFAREIFEDIYDDYQNLVIHDSFGKSEILPHYIGIKKAEDYPKGYYLCKGKCNTCKMCYLKYVNKACVIH